MNATRQWSVLFKSGKTQIFSIPTDFGDFANQVAETLRLSQGGAAFLKLPGLVINATEIAAASPVADKPAGEAAE